MNADSIGAAVALAGLVVSGQGGAQEFINLPGEDRHGDRRHRSWWAFGES